MAGPQRCVVVPTGPPLYPTPPLPSPLSPVPHQRRWAIQTRRRRCGRASAVRCSIHSRLSPHSPPPARLAGQAWSAPRPPRSRRAPAASPRSTRAGHQGAGRTVSSARGAVRATPTPPPPHGTYCAHQGQHVSSATERFSDLCYYFFTVAKIKLPLKCQIRLQNSIIFNKIASL